MVACRSGVARRLRLAAIVLALSTPLVGYAEPRLALEYQVKAGFLYNFVKFVDWPASAFPPTGDAVIIGVIGEDPFGEILDQVLQGKTCCHDRKLVVRRLQRLEHVTECHVLFISASEEARLPEILRLLDGAGVLTVGDIEGFAERGGMIGFHRESNKLRFEINADAASRAGLTISSQLLKLATRVIGKQGGGL
jgi:uncharacterized protein DUF4154